jgi:glutamyl-tRNA synthetase
VAFCRGLLYIGQYNMKDSKLIASKIFPDVTLTIEQIESKYPSRQLPEGAMVTRLGPSPTGFMHLGLLYASLLDSRMAKQTKGVYYLRVEDTDQKREVEGAVRVIIDALNRYNLVPDEGEVEMGKVVGDYGPYKQSNRLDFYNTYAKWLVENNLAYPCFTTSEELEKITKEQEEAKIRPGYRGQWAIWRDKSDEEILAALAAGKTFVIRFRSNGNFENKIKINDLIRGEREMSENDLDLVLIKSDGYPTYHFAHIIDDHLMKTTTVFRGDEWLSSLPIHLQLWQAFGWKPTQYGHISPIQKLDNGNRRKLSKRKDPEANVQFYSDAGYPPDAIIEYLLNLMNSSFEDWRKANPLLPHTDFKIDLKRMNVAGSLYDPIKLEDVSKNIIAGMTADMVNQSAWRWATTHDEELAHLLERDLEFSKAIFSIERGGENGRKDIAKWSDVKNEVGYFFDELFKLTEEKAKEILVGLNWSDVLDAAQKFADVYNESDDKDTWFGKIKTIASELGFAVSGKEFKAEPEKYKGQVGDIARIYRVLLTGRTISPDLHQVMKVLGQARCAERLTRFK